MRSSEALAISDFLQRKKSFRLILFADDESELLRVLPALIFTAVHMRPITDLNLRKFIKSKLPHMADHQIDALVLEANGDVRAATNRHLVHTLQEAEIARYFFFQLHRDF
jgi:hypothetical protein